MLASVIAPLLFAFVPLAVDKDAHCVTFTARATDVSPGTIVEFAFVGPDSDRAYEAMFVTDARIAEIAKAFDAAGIPRGAAVGQESCRFWPAGKHVSFTPSIWDFIRDKTTTNAPPIIFTGGTRDKSDVPMANANIPSALFALYSLDQSLMLLDETSDQSASYGRFLSTGKCTSGERYSFKVSWDGHTGTEPRLLRLEPGAAHSAIQTLKDAKHDLDVRPVFSPKLTIAEAKAIASALTIIDSRRVKINGYEDGQFYFRGFLPDEQWRDRTKRLTQPIEVVIDPTKVTYTIVDEDWKVEGVDPKLTPREVTLDVACRDFKGDTCLFFAKADTRLEVVYAQMKRLPNTIRNWYVFVD